MDADALEPGDHRHQSVGKRRSQWPRQDAADLGAQVRRGGANAGLRAREGSRRDAARLEAEREQRRGQRLAGRQRAIRLAGEPGARLLGRLAQPASSLVGQKHAGRTEDRVGHAFEGADHHHRAQPGVALPLDDRDRSGDVLGAPEDRTAELVDHDLGQLAGRRHGQAGGARAEGASVPSPRGKGPPLRTISGSSSSDPMRRTSVGIGSSAGVMFMPS